MKIRLRSVPGKTISDRREFVGEVAHGDPQLGRVLSTFTEFEPRDITLTSTFSF